jgi:hypothetical protein
MPRLKRRPSRFAPRSALKPYFCFLGSAGFAVFPSVCCSVSIKLLTASRFMQMEVAIREAAQARSNNSVQETRIQDLETRLSMRTNEVSSDDYFAAAEGILCF